MSKIQLKDLIVGFDRPLIKNINMDISAGKVVALLGRNGAGKSCLLKSLACLTPLISGEILIGESNILYCSTRHRAQLVSILLTDKIQLDFLKVEDLISLGRAPYTDWKNQFSNYDCKTVDLISTQVGVKDLFGKFFNELSDGQKQKVLLARALVQSPKLLLLDEPTTFLDIPTKIEFFKTLKEIAQSNQMTIILSTHDIFNLKDLCDEYWIVQNKELKNYTPEDLYSSRVLESEFGLNLN
jgi:iron complex transport system ATP-binding protein